MSLHEKKNVVKKRERKKQKENSQLRRYKRATERLGIKTFCAFIRKLGKYFKGITKSHRKQINGWKHSKKSWCWNQVVQKVTGQEMLNNNEFKTAKELIWNAKRTIQKIGELVGTWVG